MWGIGTLESLRQDASYALRGMRRNPAFSLAAVLTLALGIGVNTAVFTVVRAVVLSPLSFPAADRLVILWKVSQRNPRERSGVSPPDYLALQQQVRASSAVAAFTNVLFDVTGVDQPYRVPGARVSTNFFTTLRVQPARGRSFAPDDDRRDATRVAIIGHGLWQRQFGSNPDVIGAPVTLNAERYTVIGIMPADFAFPEIFGPALIPELFTPLRLTDEERAQRGTGYMFVVARLRPALPLVTAQAEMETLTRQFEAASPRAYGGKLLTLVPLHEQVVGGVRRLLFVLWGAVGCVLLIVCANLANMLLTRATARTRELAVRVSLGASRWRLVRQLLTESVMLAVCGGGLGLLLAVWTTHLLPSLGVTSLPRLGEVAVDSQMLGFGLGLSVLTALLFGTLPAWQISRADPQQALRQAGGRATGAGGPKAQWLRGSFVVVEMALALMLVAGAGLLIRSFLVLRDADLGFQPQNVLTFEVALPRPQYQRQQSPAFYRALLERIESLPQVQAAGAISYLPLAGDVFSWGFLVQGHPVPAGAPEPSAEFRIVSPGFFPALTVPIRAGRTFTEQDAQDTLPVGIINETLARRYWPNEDPIGRQFRLGGPPSLFPWVTVVGVTSDVHYGGVDQEPRPTIYRPLQQYPSTMMAVVVRTTANPSSLTGLVREQLRALDRDVPVFNVRELSDYVSESFALRRSLMVLLGMFAGLALFLAALGLYTVVAHSVAQRTQEIGLRMALGARPHDVLKLVTRQGAWLAILGLASGLAATLASSQVMVSLVYGITPTDPFTLGTVSAVLLVVALIGSYVPARRAMCVDPMTALRQD